MRGNRTRKRIAKQKKMKNVSHEGVQKGGKNYASSSFTCREEIIPEGGGGGSTPEGADGGKNCT